MRAYIDLYRAMAAVPSLAEWAAVLPARVDAALHSQCHGDLPKWKSVLDALPAVQPSSVDLNADTLRIGEVTDCDDSTRQQIIHQLQQLHPWRKGPFDLFGIRIDTEWRSDWKWSRLQDHIAPLEGRRVLDVGCGNGYYAWRMAGAGAALVLGLDPTLLYVMQYQALRRYIGPTAAYVLPLPMESVPQGLGAFDTVFSMGVLYHRRSPFDHLMELRDALRPGGELVLETLVVDGPQGKVLVPENRYAKMRNVWFIPSVPTLTSWLKRCRFRNVQVVDVTHTSIEEQRSTEWMRFESLSDFLDEADPTRTIEGLPAPVRVLLTAEAP